MARSRKSSEVGTVWSQLVAPEARGLMRRKLMRGEPGDEEGFLRVFRGRKAGIGVADGRFHTSKGRGFLFVFKCSRRRGREAAGVTFQGRLDAAGV